MTNPFQYVKKERIFFSYFKKQGQSAFDIRNHSQIYGRLSANTSVTGEKGIELIFSQSIRVNDDTHDQDHHDTAFIDSTVQEKNITYLQKRNSLS